MIIRRNMFDVCIRVIISLTFIISCVLKLLSMPETIEAINQYLITYNTRHIRLIVVCMCAIEFYVGVMLLISVLSDIPKYVYIIASGLIFSFFGASIARLFMPYIESCGCFGAYDIMSSPISAFVRDSILTAAIIIILIKSRISIHIPVFISSVVAITLFIIVSRSGYFDNRYIIRNYATLTSESWYGISVDVINNYTRNDLAYMYFGDDIVVDNNIYVTTVKDIYSNVLGWIVLIMAPHPEYINTRLNLGLIYDNTHQIVDCVIDESIIISNDNNRHDASINGFVNDIINTNINGIIRTSNSYKYCAESPVSCNAILKIINNATYNLITSYD